MECWMFVFGLVVLHHEICFFGVCPLCCLITYGCLCLCLCRTSTTAYLSKL